MTFKPLRGWVEALSDWGWLIPLVALIGVVVWVAIVLPEAGLDTNPTESDRDVNVAYAPDGKAMEIDCPFGWKAIGRGDQEIVVLGCTDAANPDDPEPGSWLVILEQDGKTFNVAYQIDTPGAEFITDESLVPGWQR